MDLKNSPATMAQIVEAHRRLATLRHLLTALEHQSNELILNDNLSSQGITSNWTDIRSCMKLLEECGAITIEYADRLMVARMTRRGHEVALGRVVVEGIAKPGPECAY